MCLKAQCLPEIGNADPRSTNRDVFFGGVLNDGPNTALGHLPLAQLFKEFVNKRYKDLKEEPQDTAYPAFLNVAFGRFRERTFLNVENVTVGTELIGNMLQASFLTGRDIGIIAIHG